MPWDPDDLIGCLFIFAGKHLSGMKNLKLCFEKNNMKISFTHGVGEPASLGTLPPRKQSREKPLLVVFGENNNRRETNKHNWLRLMADTENIIHGKST